MEDSVNPIHQLRLALRRSRLLRILFIATVLNFGLLLGATFFRRVHPGVAGILALFSVCTWFFALTAAASLRVHFRIAHAEPKASQRTAFVDLVASATILLVELLLLVMVAALLLQD
ncbi:MAG: hypothetical protein KDB18_13225 [Salinibacterium sp.]|nr:hypothetical protein [Planctomycetota bacterium]MCB1282477.1 hypothetical protein [Salinibacterium sp.]